MATLEEIMAGRRAEVQTQINVATADDLIPTIHQENGVVVSSNALFDTAQEQAVNTGVESKKSTSGADGSVEAKEDKKSSKAKIKAIMNKTDEMEYPNNLTEIFNTDGVTATQAVKMIKVYVKEARKEYSKSKVKPSGFQFGTTVDDKVCAAMDSVAAINRKLNDLKRTNKDAGYDVYNLATEGKRLVGTDTTLLSFLSKNTDTTV